MQNSLSPRLLISLMFFICLFCACGGQKAANSEKFHNLFVLNDSIPLEFSSESIISGISDAFFWTDKICIQQNDEFLLFDFDGNYVNKLNNKGNGPGQYNQVTWATINTENELVIYDALLNRITTYDSYLNYIGFYDLGERATNYQMFLQALNQKYYFYNTDLFISPLTIDEYSQLFEYQGSFCRFPYNSVLQLRLAGNRNLAYVAENNKLIVSHIFDPVLKLIDLDSTQNIEHFTLSPKFWKPVDEKRVRALFPHPGVNPRRLYKYLSDKSKIWKVFCFHKNLTLIEYWAPKTEFILEIINLRTKQILSTTKIPDYLGEVKWVDQKHVYFTRYYYEKENQNPTILKYRYKHE